MNAGSARSLRALGGLAALVLLTVACGGGGSGEPARDAAAEPEAGIATAPEDEAGPPAGDDRAGVAPLTSRRVRVYFPSVYFDGLTVEEHEIFETATPGDRAKQILVDLLAGPEEPTSLPAVPSGVRLRQVYWVRGGTAWADFTGEMVRGMRGGSMEEILTVYSIVNSLALNIPEIKRVGILIDGNEIDTLSGHVDLRLPLLPDRRLLRAPGRDGSRSRADGEPAASPRAASVL